MFLNRFESLGAAAVVAALAGTANAGFTITPFLLEGDAAQGTLDFFQTFDRPNISESGSIYFAADTDGDSSFDDVVYLNNQLIAQQGMAAPDSGGGEFSSFEFFETGHQVNATDGGVFIATLTDVPSSANRAIYKSDPFGSVSLVVQEGQGAAGISGRLHVDFGFAGIMDDGRVGYRADLDGSTSDDSVIYLGGAPVFRQGDAVPASLGLNPGTTWDGDFDEIQWNGAGDMIFEGNTSEASGDMVLVRRTDATGVSEVVAREGQVINASGGPDFLELILQSSIAENGMWAYRGNLGVAPSTSDAYIEAENGFTAQQGDAIPEISGAVLGNFNGVDVNSLGDVLYLADIAGATNPDIDEGLFVNGMLIVTDGVQAPGLPAGTLFSDIGFEDMYINDNRQVVFAASYTGTVTGDGLFTLTVPAPASAAAILALPIVALRRRRH